MITPAGINADALRKLIYERFHTSPSSMFRIGHLGNCNDLTVPARLAGFEMGLKLMPVPVQNSGVQAPVDYLSADPASIGK